MRAGRSARRPARRRRGAAGRPRPTARWRSASPSPSRARWPPTARCSRARTPSSCAQSAKRAARPSTCSRRPSLSEYTFIGWLRRGVAAEIDQPDTLGTDPDAGPDGHATLHVELALKTVAVPGAPETAPVISRDIAILGPGDVGGIKAEAILRSRPAGGSLQATPGELAYVEFYDEDFPWRYTPADAVGGRLRPW